MTKDLDKIVSFLKECGVFYLLTTEGDMPMGRPFGAVMACGGYLYLSTQTQKAVYKQVKDNPHVQIIALKSGTRHWIRISGLARECVDIRMKERMLKECPVLMKHFDTPGDERFALLKMEIENARLNLDTEVIEWR